MTFSKPILFIDCETTGIDTDKDRIIDLATIKISDDPVRTVSTWSMRFNPGIPIPAEATGIHGITDADVAGAPAFSEWADRLARGFEGKDLAGYNLTWFDLPIIDAELRRCGHKLSLDGVRVIDCCQIYKKKEPRDLASAVQRYCGRDHTGAHGALADALATNDVFEGQLVSYPELASMTLDELAEFCQSEDRRLADLARKLYYDLDGVLRFNFGKLRDQPVLDHPDYADWMLNKGDFPQSTCELLLETFLPKEKRAD